MTEGRLSHLLIQARDLTNCREELDRARHHIDAALLIVRRLHRDG